MVQRRWRWCRTSTGRCSSWSVTKPGAMIPSARSAISGAVGGEQSTYYLMNIATVIWELMRNASPGVGRTITQRLKTMLRPSDDHAYEEALVELEIGGMIASRVSPVLLEPLVPRDWRPSQGEQPTSPDYGVRVPEGLVTVEVTVWHW